MSEAQPRYPLRVAVIDDYEDIRHALRLALDREDDFVVVTEAGDGEAGVAAVVEHQPDLVLLDIAMPVMDGLQALTLIRERSRESIIILLTGFSEEAAALSAVEHGAHGYIRKGGSMPELLNRIREILEVRRTGRHQEGR